MAAVLLGVSRIQAQRATLQRHTVEVDGHPMAVWEKSPTGPGGDHAAHLETPRPTFIHAMISFLRRPR